MTTPIHPELQVPPSSEAHNPLDEESRIDSPHSHTSNPEYRFDSAIDVSLASSYSGLIKHKPIDSSYFVYPPVITGHGRLVRARQTIPSWAGILVVVGIMLWALFCAWNVHSWIFKG